MNLESTQSQVDICYTLLRDMIVRCEIAPGERLTEKALIERLGFGRTPVREALLRLDQDRLIDTRPRSGYQVRPLTRKSIDDFFVAWRVIVPAIVKLAVANFTPAERSAMQRLGERQLEVARDDVVGNASLSEQFFSILVGATGNEPLTYIYNRLGAEMMRVFQAFFTLPPGKQWLAKSHDLYMFSKVTDADLAARRVDESLKNAHVSFMAHIDDCSHRGEPIFSA